MKTRLSITVVFLMLFAFSCQDRVGDQVEPDVQGIEDLNISDDFSFENTQDINFEITLPSTVDYSAVMKRVDIYTKAPANGGKRLKSVISDNQGVATITGRVPAYYDSLYISSFAGSGYAVIEESAFKATNEGGIIQFDFNEEYGFDPPGEAEEGNKSAEAKLASGNSADFLPKNAEVLTNIIGNPGFDNGDYGTQPYWSSPMSADGKWYFSENIRNNANQISQGNKTFLRISGGNNVYGGVVQHIDAAPGDVITFSSDIRIIGSNSSYFNKIWLYLIPLNSAGNPITYYNVLDQPVSSNWHSKTVTASMPSGTASCRVLYWSWAYYNNNVRIDIDNAFVSGPVQDADGDGVDDEEDDYPNDSERAFDIYYPAQDEFGSLGFEDNWPGKGDYDFNDLVVDYNYHQVLNAGNEMVDMTGLFSVRAIGASFENGFGIQLGADPEDVSNVTGIEVPGEYINLAANNTEMGQDKATIILFENAFDILPHPGGGLGVNTEQNAPYVEPELMTIEVEMQNPVHVDEIGLAPFNPFLIIDKERGREAHLADKEPTSLANQSYFATADDDSDQVSGRYYKTANNLPWAIDIPAYYNYPLEKIVIIDAYNHFEDWAQSEGGEYADWYLNEAGYRNSSNIYQEP